MACRLFSIRGRDAKCIPFFLCENLKERDHFEYIGLDGSIILKWIYKM